MRKFTIQLLSFVALLFFSSQIFGQATDLFFSEYIEGSSNNKALEIYNGTGNPVDLSNYEVWRISNGGNWPENSYPLTGTLADGDVFVIANSSAGPEILAVADMTSGATYFNGDDAIGLAKDIGGTMTLIDAVGEEGPDPGSGWDVAGVTNATAEHTLVRKSTICSPNTNWPLSAGTNAIDSEWIVYNQDDFGYIGSHTASCSGGNIAPFISNVVQTPSEDIEVTTTVSVSADVTDSDGTVDLVELNWGTTSGLLSNSIVMTNGGSGDTYTTSTDIPAQAVGTTVYYEVYAEDNIGDGSVSIEYSYTVIEAQTTTIPYAEPFDTDLGQCYTKSVSGTTKFWGYGSYGGNGFADMNGYNSGDTEEDWLILPGIDFDSYSNEIMSFDTWYNYGTDDENNYLKLYYSEDYPGIGDPSGYSWTELSYTQGASQNWTSSGYIDLSAIAGTSIYIAFEYQYEAGNWRHWEIDNISIVESVPVNVTFQVNMTDETVSGDGVHVAGSFNGWDPAATLMTDAGGGIYTTTLPLFSNREYQFKYINGNDWPFEEDVPAECEAPGSTNRFEFTGSPDYSIPVVCFGSCADCGTLFDYDITFQVDMQNESVLGDVYLAGDFNGWADQAMTNTGGTIYELTFTLTEGSYHEYKFKNGPAGWESFNGSCVVWDGGNRFMNTPSVNTTLDLVCFNSCDACPLPEVMINEVDADTPSTDVMEFIELYDGGTGNTDLSGLVVVLFNGNGDISYNAFDLDGYSTDANGYFLLGNADVVPTPSIIFPSNTLQNGADAIALYLGSDTDFPNGTAVTDVNLLDALVYDTSDGDDSGLLILLNPGQPQINEGGRGDKDNHSNQRIPNGSGGQRNTITYDQSLPTPGAENSSVFTDWTGFVDSNWDDAGNWNNGIPNPALEASIPDVSKAPFPIITGSATCMSLYMATGSSLEIATTGSLTVIGTFTNAGGNLTIKSDASGTGSLIENNGVNANVERYYTGGQWHLISSPVSTETANMFLGLYLQNHDEPTNTYYDIVDPLTPLNVMQGYALWDYNTGTATFTGPVNTGALSIGLTRTASGAWDYGWNLVGNPYPSSIDWLAASGWTKTNVSGTMYLYTGSTWATFSVPGSGTNGGTQYVAPGQGFFVNVNDDGSTTGTLGMDNFVRAHNPTNFFKDELNNVLKLEVAANGYTDETAIIFREDATTGFDTQYDAHKLFSLNSAVPQIYSTANNFMAVNILPDIISVAIDVKANDGESITIAAVETSDFENVYLEDLYTGSVTNLITEDYTFTSFEGVEDRFIVHFLPLSVGNNMEELINIYSHQQDVFVIVPESTQGEIFIYNMMGQVVANTQINGTLNEVTLKESGYYIVKVVSAENTITQKVFIK